MSDHRDVFRPHRQPAQGIYDAFQAEAALRSGRKLDEWLEAERQAVWRAARDYAQQQGLRVPTIDEIKRAENYAAGSVDYGAKWAYQIERLLKESTAA